MKLANHIEITGTVLSEQGNKLGRNNWLRKLHETTKVEEVLVSSLATGKVSVQLVSEDKEVNELLSRIIGDIRVGKITFPFDDVPKQPRCNGYFNQYTGLITHDQECELDVHKEGVRA